MISIFYHLWSKGQH